MIPKKVFQIGSGPHVLNGGETNPVSKSTGTGTLNGILITATAAFDAADKVTIQFRDAKGSKPIVIDMLLLDACKMTDLRFNNMRPTMAAYIPVGCVTLGNDAEIDIKVTIVTGSASKTVYVTGVLENESAYTIKQHIAYVGSEISNKEIDELWLLNAATLIASAAACTIEIGFKNGRSEFVTVQELWACSEIFNQGTTANGAVLRIYQNRSRLNEIEYVKCSLAAASWVYTTDFIDEEKVSKPLIIAAQSQNATLANSAKLQAAKKAFLAEKSYYQNIAAPAPISIG